MATRKEIIIKHYLEFQKQLQGKKFDCSIFPSLEDVDLVDLLVLFNYTFNNSKFDTQWLFTQMKQICKQQQNALYKKKWTEIRKKKVEEKNKTVWNFWYCGDETAAEKGWMAG